MSPRRFLGLKAGLIGLLLLTMGARLWLRAPGGSVAAIRFELKSIGFQLESLVSENPREVDAHISLATAYYRLKRKQDGNKQPVIVLARNAERLTTGPGGASK
jgi:hypothetical protein